MKRVWGRWLINAVAVWAAIQIVPGIRAEGDWVVIALVGLLLGLVNTFIRPIITFLSCPLMMLTLGLFTLVVNAAVLGITSWLARALGLSFVVDGFWAALLGGLVISVVSVILSAFFSDDDKDRRDRRR